MGCPPVLGNYGELVLQYLSKDYTRTYLKNAPKGPWLRCHAEPDSASILLY